MILVLVMYMLFASTFTIGKIALTYVNPILFIGIRMSLAGCILLLYLFFTRKKITIAAIDWKYFLYIMFFHIYCAYIFEFIALQTIDSAKACLFYNFSPFITAALLYALLGERISLRQTFGLLIGFVGLAVLIFTQAQKEVNIINSLNISLSEIFMLISVCSSAYGWIIFKKLVTHKNYSPILVNGIGMLGGGLLALVTSLAVEGIPIISQPLELTFYTLLLILIANVIGYNMYGYLLQKYSPTLLSFAGFTTPLFAALFGWMFLSEHVTVYFFIALAFVTGGLALFYRDE